ncbi:MAG: putative baseplate assembly protein, partial [bacterium]
SLTSGQYVIAKARNTNHTSTRARYGSHGKSTRIELGNPSNPAATLEWITADLDTIAVEDPTSNTNNYFQAIRGAVVYAQSERLELAEEPMTESIGAQSEDEITDPRRIELDAVYDGLESGRWLMVSGERNDIDGVTGVTARELVMLAAATQEFDATLPGDKTHTELELANELAFRYKRETVAINANVARATHGETRTEVLGSGDSSKAFQKFELRQAPLTHVSAATPNGIESTLEVRVNDVRWREKDSLVALAAVDRNYVTRTDDNGKTSIAFGNGAQGSRLPSGSENVKAIYRSGIGKAGNVASGQISLLSTKPLGVKSVLNPQAASGGADPEDRDHARQNAALHLKAIDRAVSVQDYADFARAFTGIAKTRAARLADGLREVVHLTIAGAEDISITKDSDLYRNLRQALLQFGDPHQPLKVEPRELR